MWDMPLKQLTVLKAFFTETQTEICPVIHNSFCSCIQKFNSVSTRADVLFIIWDASEKVHLCVLLISIHQTADRDVLACASVSRLIMSLCLLFVSISKAAKHSLTLGIMARQDGWCQVINIRASYLGWVADPGAWCERYTVCKTWQDIL